MKGRVALASATCMLAVAVGAALASTTKRPAPFAYTFRITAMTVRSTFTAGSATATTTMHLAAPPKQKTLSYRGPEGGGMSNGVAETAVQLTGTANYTGLDPTCDVSVPVVVPKPAQATLILANSNGPVVAGYPPAIDMEIDQLAVASTLPPNKGACENGALRLFTFGHGVDPVSVISRARFSISPHGHQDVSYQTGYQLNTAVLDWTAVVVVKRIKYKRLNCAHNPLC